jgi:ADP-ribosylglycohydrolase
MDQRNARLRSIIRAALVGDALGAPFNGLKHGHIQQLAGGQVEGFLTDPLLQPDRPERNRLPGLHGSIGQRLIGALAFGAPDDLGRDPVARVGTRLQELAGEGEDEGYRLGSIREPGRPLRRAIMRWRAEYPWEAADFLAKAEVSEGISAAVMGIAAVACAPADPAATAVQLARLTHFRSTGVMPAVAVALLLESLLAHKPGEKIDAQGLVHDLIPRLHEHEKAYEDQHAREWRELGWGRPRAHLSKALEPLPSLLREENDDLAIRTIVATAEESAPEFKVTHPQHGFAAAAIPWAFYRALGPLAPVRSLEDIINRGGETSAIAAIVAALSVARHGAGSLPDEWYAAALAAPMVDQLIPAVSSDAFDQWVAAEARWTAGEEELREPLRDAIRRQKAVEADRARRKPPKKSSSVPQEDAPFAPPPHLWLKPGEEEDPKKKKILKEQRARRRIDWKEERKDKRKQGPEDE